MIVPFKPKKTTNWPLADLLRFNPFGYNTWVNYKRILFPEICLNIYEHLLLKSWPGEKFLFAQVQIYDLNYELIGLCSAMTVEF